MPQPIVRRAFTLVELVIAVGLSTFILLIAASAFRMMTKAINQLTKLDQENRLLRTGYLAVIDDADFWHSMANPDFPWAKTRMRQAEGPFVPADLQFTSPVTAQIVHPNQCQPNDRRLWYRNHYSSGITTYYVVKSDSNGNGKFDDVLPNGALHQARDGSQNPRRFFSYSASNDYWQIGTGWDMWHIWGDYSELASTNPGASLDPVSDATEMRYRIWRAELMKQLHSQLGIGGVATYTWPGNMNLFLNANGNRTDANVGTARYRENIGEIPGQNLHALAAATTAARGTWEKGYFYNMPGAIDSQAWTKDGILANCYERPMASDFNMVMINRNNTSSPTAVGMVFSPKMVQSDKNATTWSDSLISAFFHEPFRIITAEGRGSSNYYSNDVLRRNMSETMLVPRAMSDSTDLDLSELPPGTPMLAIAAFRATVRSQNRTVGVVRLQDPETGAAIEIGVPLITTTYRGARQHWGWRTRYDQPTLDDIGDYYE